MLTLRGQMAKMMCQSTKTGPRMQRVMSPKTNQDIGTMLFPFAGNKKQALFAVADGHGDKGEFASDVAMRCLLHTLHSDKRMADVDSRSSELRAAFTEAFELANHKLHTSRELRSEQCSGGTTMIVVLVTPHKVHVAWAGDSRCAMGSGAAEGKPLSRDHTVSIQSEWRRVERAGGRRMLNEQTGGARVVVPGNRPDEFHTLAMSRSLGDKAFHAAGVIATPDVNTFELADCTGPCMLVVASDGVWEHIDNTEAVQIIASPAGAAQPDTAQAACHRLMQHTAKTWAKANPMYRDDITAVVVDLSQLCAVFQQASKPRRRPTD
eukprot:TRINITY_DN40340_c0_g1_i1.p1 TRINITY_DN40340_c0_g1~~TRINITY_DN40340_c0_g1_i1.p1  ORF type:complete len:322 (+),score=88.35 TRINITY_DN40340_c0_g1_i1:159-1124(+)